MSEVQRSFDLSILEGQVTAEADIQLCWATVRTQPKVGTMRGLPGPTADRCCGY